MRGEVLVALLVTGVLGDEVEVLAANDQSTVHLGGDDGAGEDTATDGDEASEGALLVCNITRSVAILQVLVVLILLSQSHVEFPRYRLLFCSWGIHIPM